MISRNIIPSRDAPMFTVTRYVREESKRCATYIIPVHVRKVGFPREDRRRRRLRGLIIRAPELLSRQLIPPSATSTLGHRALRRWDGERRRRQRRETTSGANRTVKRDGARRVGGASVCCTSFSRSLAPPWPFFRCIIVRFKERARRATSPHARAREEPQFLSKGALFSLLPILPLLRRSSS